MFILKRTHNRRIEELKQECQVQITRIQNTVGKELDEQNKRRNELEAKIIDAQEKNQQFFYKKEKELKDQVLLGVIDHKEYHYSLRLLNEVEKALK